MQLRLERPWVRAITKDGGFYAFPVEAWEPLRTAWMAGKAFWEGQDAWGQPIIVRLGDVVGLCYKTADALEVLKAEDDEERRRKMLQGED